MTGVNEVIVPPLLIGQLAKVGMRMAETFVLEQPVDGVLEIIDGNGLITISRRIDFLRCGHPRANSTTAEDRILDEEPCNQSFGKRHFRGDAINLRVDRSRQVATDLRKAPLTCFLVSLFGQPFHFFQNCFECPQVDSPPRSGRRYRSVMVVMMIVVMIRHFSFLVAYPSRAAV